MAAVVAMFGLSCPVLRAQEAAVPAEYQAFESCAQDTLKARAKDALEMATLDQMRDKTLAEVDQKCAKLLPPEAQANRQSLESTVVLLTAPEKQDGVNKGPVTATAGAIVQTKTGASLVLSGGGEIDLPKESIFSLTQGYKLRAAGTVAVGTTATGQSDVPNANVTLEAGRALDGRADDQQKAMLNQLQVNTAGFDAASLREVMKLTFDRDTAMDRPWDVSAGYGRELSISGPDRGVDLTALVEGGVGQSGSKTLPYARLTVGADGYICAPIHGEKHLVCAGADLAAGLGLIQAKLDVGVSADYKYVASDRNDAKAWIHSISVGPSFQQSLQEDLAGGHAATQGMFAITIQ